MTSVNIHFNTAVAVCLSLLMKETALQDCFQSNRASWLELVSCPYCHAPKHKYELKKKSIANTCVHIYTNRGSP